MGKETILFKSEEKMSSASGAAILRKLADKIENGKVVLVHGSKKVTLKIPQNVEVEIKAEKEESKKRTKKKIEVEIEWVVGAPSDVGPVKIK